MLPLMGIIGSYVMWTLPLKEGEHQAENVFNSGFNRRRPAPWPEHTSSSCRHQRKSDFLNASLYPSGRDLAARQPRTQHAVPPHDRARYKHGSRGKSEYCPDRLRHLVAESGAAARNPDAVNATEMQEGEPINDLVADA